MAFGSPGEYALIVDGEATPEDRARIKKLMARLNDSVDAGGPVTQSLQQTAADGTTYTARVGPGVKEATITRMEPSLIETHACHPLRGVISAPKPFPRPELFFTDWPVCEHATALAPFEDHLYAFGAPDRVVPDSVTGHRIRLLWRSPLRGGWCWRATMHAVEPGFVGT